MTNLAMDANLEQMAMSQVDNSVPRVQNVMARFMLESVQQDVESRKAGRPVFKDEIYIELITPGSGRIFRRPAFETDKAKFRRQWEAFEANEEQPLDGTPINEFPVLTRATVDNLKALGVHTVEALANMPDREAQKIMGGAGWREKAVLWLAGSDDAKTVADMEARDSKIAEQEEQLDAQNVLIEKMEKRLAELESDKD